MTWTISSVQNVSLEDSLPTRPGFVIQHEEGSSPLLTLVFEDQKTAQDCASTVRHQSESIRPCPLKAMPKFATLKVPYENFLPVTG